ncbi:MAG: hypothetical protein HKN79_09620, partial [Flavobacteriales bacterium]|nr:hypothetical protein [Flavobacteriales bacterium]
MVALLLPMLSYSQSVSFVNVADSIGLDYQFNGPSTDGSGISFIDHDDDGKDDISYGTHTGLIPSFWQVIGDTLVMDTLSGLDFEIDGSRSIIWVDYDNDGDKDLCLTNVNSLITAPARGTPKLYRRDAPDILVDV